MFNFYKLFTDNNMFSHNKSAFNNVNLQNISSIANRNLEIMIEGSKMYAKNNQAIMSDQIQVSQKNFSSIVKQSQEAMLNSNPESSMDKTINLFKNIFDHTVENIKELSEKTAKSNAEIFDLVSSKLSENISECANCASDVAHNVSNTVKKKSAAS